MLNSHDIAAMENVLQDLQGQIESMDVEQSIIMLEAVKSLKAKAHETIAHIEVWLADILESPRQIGGNLYEVKNAGKWRPDHDSIKKHAHVAAFADKESGEVYGGMEAAERAVEIMYDLFVSPSSMPKTGALERLGLDKSDVADFHREGKRISVTNVG